MSSRSTRRSFFGHAGAALAAAPLAATAAFAGQLDGRGYVVGSRAALEDANAIRALQQRYARLVGTGDTEAIAALLAEPADAAIDVHVRRMIVDGDDTIDISRDGAATARVPCLVTTITPIENCGTLVEMARLQGDGFVKRTERRVLRSRCVKRGGAWKIARTDLEA